MGLAETATRSRRLHVASKDARLAIRQALAHSISMEVHAVRCLRRLGMSVLTIVFVTHTNPYVWTASLR